MPNIKIVSDVAVAEVKLENLKGKAEPRKIQGKDIEMKADGSPKIVYRSEKGKELHFVRLLNGKPLVDEVSKEPISLENGYIDEEGQVYRNGEVIPHYATLEGNTIVATKVSKTDLFEVKKWHDQNWYTDKYLIDRYYQVSPRSSSKKEYAKIKEINISTAELKKLYDYMLENKVIGRGKLNITSAGYLDNDAYIRPVSINGTKWTLEIGIFKQLKVFKWVEEINYKPIATKQREIRQVAEVEEI